MGGFRYAGGPGLVPACSETGSPFPTLLRSRRDVVLDTADSDCLLHGPLERADGLFWQAACPARLPVCEPRLASLDWAPSSLFLQLGPPRLCSAGLGLSTVIC